MRHLLLAYRNVFIKIGIAFVRHFKNLINIRLELTFALYLYNAEMIQASCVLRNLCDGGVDCFRNGNFVFSPYGVLNKAERTEMIDVIRIGIKRCKHIFLVKAVREKALFILIAVSERTADLIHTVFLAELFNRLYQRFCDFDIIYHINAVEAHPLLTVFFVCEATDNRAYPADSLAVLICHHQLEIAI